jgi:anthranilate synthase component 1
VIVERLPRLPDLLALAAADPRRYPCLLESVASGPATARYDLLFVHAGNVIAGGPDFLRRLATALAALPPASDSALADLPYTGGYVCLLSYELAAECEPILRMPAAPGDAPVAVALRAPAAVVIDRDVGVAFVVAEPGCDALIAAVRADLAAVAPPVTPATVDVAWSEDDPALFLRGVTRVQDWLAAGDVFQVNLSRGWQARLPVGVDPCALYARLREANPAPFAGLFRHGDFAVLSSSPERLVAVRAGQVSTRPIAGTRPRGGDDAARVRELVGHPKERAEHVMLIDLERNDLGRVCVPGSVTVDEMMTVESYRHVHHIVSNVSGRLRAGVGPVDVLRAVFPGGTITGCPKVRCMQIIAELEGIGRGPYTGALGYIDRRGWMDFNILIRTLWIDQGVARVRAGSGIVVDSVPEAELAETRAKARGVLAALGDGR